jgi:hypothetical protein
MIKPGSLVRLDPNFGLYSSKPEKDHVGLVINTEKAFYEAVTIFHAPQDRHYILWGNERYSYEPTRALIEVKVDD